MAKSSPSNRDSSGNHRRGACINDERVSDNLVVASAPRAIVRKVAMLEDFEVSCRCTPVPRPSSDLRYFAARAEIIGEVRV